jgi:hypothetical protein
MPWVSYALLVPRIQRVDLVLVPSDRPVGIDKLPRNGAVRSRYRVNRADGWRDWFGRYRRLAIYGLSLGHDAVPGAAGIVPFELTRAAIAHEDHPLHSGWVIV